MLINKIIGIYKITSPSGRIYIGQTINYKKRIYKYKILQCKSQRKLYNSFMKYGFKNHIIELIEECNIESLNERERYYQDYYNVVGKKGLNCKLQECDGKSGELSNEVKYNMKQNSGKARKIKCMLTGIIYNSCVDCAKDNNLDCKYLSHILNRDHINSTSFIYLDTIPEFEINYLCKIKSSGKRKVINKITNQVWDSITECAKENNINKSTLINKLLNNRFNDTPYGYIEII